MWGIPMIVVFADTNGAGALCAVCGDRLKGKSNFRWEDVDNGRKPECV